MADLAAIADDLAAIADDLARIWAVASRGDAGGFAALAFLILLGVAVAFGLRAVWKPAVH